MDVTTFAVVTDTGEMRNFELGPATSVRIADRELTDEVGRYLRLVGSSRARDLRRMTISALGAGDREVFVSYISEVPVWKSTYRIILPDKPADKPLLLGVSGTAHAGVTRALAVGHETLDKRTSVRNRQS